MPASQKLILTNKVAEFTALAQQANDFTAGASGGVWVPPENLEDDIDEAKRHEALFLMAAKTYKQQVG